MDTVGGRRTGNDGIQSRYAIQVVAAVGFDLNWIATLDIEIR